MSKYRGVDIDLTPTEGMAEEAKRALAWKKEGKRGGTRIGLTRANQLAKRTELSASTVRRMRSFFARHSANKPITGFRKGEKGYPNPTRVAWGLWGGDPGETWANAKDAALDRIDAKKGDYWLHPTQKTALGPELLDELARRVRDHNRLVGEDESRRTTLRREAGLWLAEKAEGALAEGDFVRWRSSGGTARGRIDRIVRDGEIDVPDSAVTITATPDDPAALITVWRKKGDGWAASDTKVGHKLATLTKIAPLAAPTKKGDTTGGDTSSHVVAIKKVDAEKQVVYGEVYAPYVLDTHGEFMLPEDIEIMAHRFMKLDLANAIDTDHDNVPNGSWPIESYIAKENDEEYTPGSWVLGVKIVDPVVWARVKSGELNGFSFQSMVRPVEMDVEYLVLRDHVGQTEVHEDHEHVFFLAVDDQGRVVSGSTNEVNGHKHVIRRASVTEMAAAHTHRFFL